MIKITCIECGEEFTASDSELRFYKEKNFKIPKRCKKCRDKRKQSNKYQEDYAVEEQDSLYRERHHISYNQNKSKGRRMSNLRFSFVVIIILVCVYSGFHLSDFFTGISDTTSSEVVQQVEQDEEQSNGGTVNTFSFRSSEYREEHFEKHGSEFTFATAEEYEAGANAVISNPDSLHKLEKEDNDDIYYLESTNEFVVVSTDGYIRTYCKPDNGKEYYDEQ